MSSGDLKAYCGISKVVYGTVCNGRSASEKFNSDAQVASLNPPES